MKPMIGNETGFWQNRTLQGLIAWYLLWWSALAISPIDRSDWLLENLLVFGMVGALVATYRIFPLSNASYLWITVFLTLHAVGAHYTYSKVPLGFALQDAFDLSRNHFDRIVHFSFGLLLGYPIREVLGRVLRPGRFWLEFLTVNIVLSLSGFFELIESWVAQMVSPELGIAYLGTQGDVWDAQKDTTAALVGVLLCLFIIATMERLREAGFVPPVRALQRSEG